MPCPRVWTPSDQELEAAFTTYLAGRHTLVELAAEHGLTESTFQKAMRLWAIKTDRFAQYRRVGYEHMIQNQMGRGKWALSVTPAQCKQLLRRYLAGERADVMAAELGIKPNTLTTRLRMYAGKMGRLTVYDAVAKRRRYMGVDYPCT